MEAENATCKRCGTDFPRGVPHGNRWVERTGDTCNDCESGRTLARYDDMIQRTEAMLALMEGSNAILTNPAFLRADDGEAQMHAAILALGYSKWMARNAIVYQAGKGRYDALEIQSTRDDLVRLNEMRERYCGGA